MSDIDFIQHYVANAGQMMWFLGAGTSRTAGMPTATDITWDLKFKLYCREENQDIKGHDLHNEKIKNRVQSYMDSKGFPTLWSVEEYSHYFEKTFGTNYEAQQRYLADQLNSKKISLNIGHRALAGLIALQKARVIFTTNFDEVIETGCIKVGGTPLPTYHLEGSYAALSALNAEQFPIYAKVHGDFRYQSVKNLSTDLLSNDAELQKCFVAASNRYGIVVTGYSGRDGNVMEMFEQAISQPNAFPSGLFWTVTSLKSTMQVVIDFIQRAKEKGINAHIVETGTFDSMLSRIWRQMPGRPDAIDKKVRSATTKTVDIALLQGNMAFPILRMNALPVTVLPSTCAVVNTTRPLSGMEVKEWVGKNKGNACVIRGEEIYAWGSDEQIRKSLGAENIVSIAQHTFDSSIETIEKHTAHHRFFERALVISLCDYKPLLLRNDKAFVLAIDPAKSHDPLFAPLKEALKDRNGNIKPLSGIVPGADAKWSEAVRLKLENRDGKVWLMLRPMIWIEPHIARQNHMDFVRQKVLTRYNLMSSNVLDAWITILLGTKEKNINVKTIYGKDTQYPAVFEINSRTAFSGK